MNNSELFRIRYNGNGVNVPMENERYWFPAKRFGWGWGPPATWQGWTVLLAYIGLVILFSVALTRDRYPIISTAGIVVSTGLLLLVCYFKGEPPSWRWGGHDLK